MAISARQISPAFKLIVYQEENRLIISRFIYFSVEMQL